MFLNWTLIISNSITGAIQASFSAVAVYLAMKMVNHAEKVNKNDKKDGEK